MDGLVLFNGPFKCNMVAFIATATIKLVGDNFFTLTGSEFDYKQK